MVKTLTKHGNSYAIILDKPILELLGIDPDSPLEISTDGKVLTIAPVRDAARRKRFDAARAKVGDRYRRVFKRLAE